MILFYDLSTHVLSKIIARKVPNFFNNAEQLFSGIKIKFEEIVRCSFVPGKISM